MRVKGYQVMKLKDVSVVKYVSKYENNTIEYDEDYNNAIVFKTKEVAEQVAKIDSGTVSPYF